MSQDRLQKILARAGMGSRRSCEEIVRAGRVRVNGTVATLGDSADPLKDAIKVDGKRLKPPEAHRYLMLNKPKGYITSKSDPEGRPTVMDLVPPMFRKGLVPVGRLDFHTEGLLLLTTDGDFAQRVAHPSYGCKKTYTTKVKGYPSLDSLRKLRDGVVIDGRRTSPARVNPLKISANEQSPNSWWTIEIGEGRTRQIREMFFRVGHQVLKLKRVAIGGISDSTLQVGELRELTPKEIAILGKRGRSPKPPKARRRRGGNFGAGARGSSGSSPSPKKRRP